MQFVITELVQGAVSINGKIIVHGNAACLFCLDLVDFTEGWKCKILMTLLHYKDCLFSFYFIFTSRISETAYR